MPSAKSQFTERLGSLRQSLEIEAVTNESLSEAVQNRVAKMLRNGLAVVGFAALEDFIKSRTSEVLDGVGLTGVPFANLPKKLREATTFGAISSLSYQLSLRAKTDRTAYIQEHAQKIASTANTAYELTPHALGYGQANLQGLTVKETLNAFSISDPWAQMTALGSRLGLVALPLEETFKSAAIRRHKAAHVANADTPQSDLRQYIKESLAIAIGFDWLISNALKRLVVQDLDYLTAADTPNVGAMKIRSIRYQSGQWKEQLEDRLRAVKVDSDRSSLINLARPRASQHGNLFVVYDDAAEIESWECF